MRLAVIGAAGAGTGLVAAVTSSPLWLLPWALASAAVGVLAGSLRRAALEGAVLGFAIAYVFMLGVYDGRLAHALVPFLGFGAVGGCCAALLATAAAEVSRRVRENRAQARK